MARVPLIAARALLVLVGLLLFAVLGEAALRVIYHDAGTRTLGGPGGRLFDHQTTDGEHRGLLDVGPKTPGMPRLMVVGDSITYGLGVRNWQDTWPALLAGLLEKDGRRHQFAVFAVPGNDMPQHLATLRTWVHQVQPDVLIYQWYVNDIEAISHRPDFHQPWQKLPWHRTLQSWSYLYFVLDHRFSQLLSPPNRTYLAYLKHDFNPGTAEWTEYEREFHEFAVLASRASRRIMILYPQVPFRGAYPLQSIHDRMRALAGSHALEIPPITWVRAAGFITPLAQARWGQAVRTAESGALSVKTGDYLFAAGPVQLRISVAGAPAGVEFATVSLVDVAGGTVVASGSLQIAAPSGIDEVTVPLVLPGDRVRRLAVHVTATGSAEWAITNITIPVNYGFELIDLKDVLNTFDTHASSFDAHPNERAHRVIAEMLHAALGAPPPGASRGPAR